MHVGAYLRESLSDPLVYVAPDAVPLQTIVLAVVGGVVFIVVLSVLIICSLVFHHRTKLKRLRRSEMEWIDMISPTESRRTLGIYRSSTKL